jgi:aspartyl/glutamyl-tRNA(Asn/Gln) amidotransferase C subunit
VGQHSEQPAGATPRPPSGDEATAREVALLARLELAPDEEALLGGELARILEAFRALGRAEVGGVAPLVAPLAPGTGGLRPDVPARGLAREELLARAPETSPASAGTTGAADGGEPVFFRVPRAIPRAAPDDPGIPGTKAERG